MRPHQAPSPWTGDCISLLRPQKHPNPWTKVTSWHRASTPGTLYVDRRLHFSSASTKTPPSVDKSHLLAPCVHARHPLRGQAAAFLFCVHKNTPICGQKSPTGTVCPRQAPSVWTGGCISLPHPQKHPNPWTKVTNGHRASTPGTLSVDRRLHFSSASTKTPPSVDKSHQRTPCVHARHPLRGQKSPPGTVRPHQAPSPWTGGCISLLCPQKHPHLWTKVTSWHRASTPSTLSVDRRQLFCYFVLV